MYAGYRALRQANQWDLYSEHAERLARAYYYANISFIDEQIGRILATARETGALDNALVVFTSDHGELLGDHWLWAKSQAYEGALRVPLVVWGPQWIAGGGRCEAPVSLLDVFPTVWQRLARAGAGVGVLAERPGRDLVALAAGARAGAEVDDAPQCIELGAAPRRLLAIRTRAWKYAWHENGAFEELFDLVNDPGELLNLAADGGYAGEKGALQEQLRSWIHQHSDPARAFAADGGFPRADFRPHVGSRGPLTNDQPPWRLGVPPACLPSEQVPWWWRSRIDHRVFLEP